MPIFIDTLQHTKTPLEQVKVLDSDVFYPLRHSTDPWQKLGGFLPKLHGCIVRRFQTSYCDAEVQSFDFLFSSAEDVG